MPHLRDALENSNLEKSVIEGYLRLYDKYSKGAGKIEGWDSIHSPEPELLPDYYSLKDPDPGFLKTALGKLVVCKLNGGLGTSMGCRGPKSLIVVKQGKTFMDLILDQLTYLKESEGVDLPLLLMNSFSTHADTLEAINGYGSSVSIECFQQNKFPRIIKESDLPLSEKEFGASAWYPPGHGDFYQCLQQLGLPDKYLEEGKEIIFVSNADNLGAVPDPKILTYMLDNDVPFLMEMTNKTLADVKGGTLYQQEGRLRLLELARVPDEHVDEFCSVEKFKVFNTNNIWINLRHLKKRLEEGPLDLEIIVNEKTVAETPVIQLETAIGSGLDNFPGAVGLRVDRSRFKPVKKTDDLLLVQSNLFKLQNGMLIKNKGRKAPDLPRVTLGEEFKLMDDYLLRLPVSPDLLELASLSIEGDVKFEGEVVMKGEVRLSGKGKTLSIPKGSVLDNCVMEA